MGWSIGSVLFLFSVAAIVFGIAESRAAAAYERRWFEFIKRDGKPPERIIL